jgi:hypothetical protein
MQCPKCGSTRNSREDRLCNLCGEVLAAVPPGDTAIPDEDPLNPPAMAGSPPSTISPPPSPAAPGASRSGPGAEEKPEDPSKSDSIPLGGLCHLKCSLLDRPLRLKPGRAVTVGRVKENDISVPSQMVSRHHGRFAFEKGVWTYSDLKSSNGTRVNGKRVERAVLQSGDVVDVGGFMITYKEIHDLKDVTDQGEEDGKTLTIDPSMLKRAAMAGMDGVAMLGGLGGSLADISIPDILQLLETQRKSGTLTLDFEGAVGKIFLRGGRMIHAEYGKITGEIAVHKMLGKVKGSFHLDPRDPKTEETIHRPTTTVLMDAARSMDEKAQDERPKK